MGERHVAGLARRGRHGEADELRLHRIEAGGLGVEGDVARRPGLRHPGLEVCQVGDGLVLGAVDLCRSCRLQRGRDGGGRTVTGSARSRLAIDRRRLPGAAAGRNRLAARDRGGSPLDRRRRLGPQAFGDALGQRREFHLAQEAQQGIGLRIAHTQLLDRCLERNVVLEQHQLARDARLLGELGQPLAPLGLLDLAGALQQRVEVAVLVDELGGGLHADARHAGDIVGGVARQRLNVDHLVRRHAELLTHLVGPDRLVLHGVEHRHARLDELHQVLVGGDDGHVAAGSNRVLGVGGDQVVRLEAQLLDAGDVEGPHCLADQRELGNELFRRGRTMRLVVLIDLVAKGLLAGIEDDGEVRRPAPLARILQQLPQHGTEAVHGAHGQSVRGARQRRQGVEGAKDVARAVDQIDVAAFDDGHRLAGGNGAGRRRPCRFLGSCRCRGHGRAL